MIKTTASTDTSAEQIRRLEELAAWHRAIAERVDCSWVRDARLLAAETHERQAAHLRDQVARRQASLPSIIKQRRAYKATKSSSLPFRLKTKTGKTSYIIARDWLLDLRRGSVIELGGTSRPRDIWFHVLYRIDAEAVTNRGVSIALSTGLANRVKRTAKEIAEYGVAIDQYSII